jgi:phospholipid/cholesterol/gamma-HCH transport system substrate-binding protein
MTSPKPSSMPSPKPSPKTSSMPSPKTSSKRKIRAGLFAIGAAALAAVAVIAFGGMRVLRGGDAYYIDYADTVYGLDEGAHVYLSGVPVGSVDDIAVSPDDPRQVRVRIVVRTGTPVRADTRALLQLTGITGLKVIDLRGGAPGSPPVAPGGKIIAGETTIDKLQQRAAELADQSVEMMTRANRILENVIAATDPQGELLQNARRGAADLAAATAALRAIADENRVAIRRSVDEVGQTARAVSALIDGRVAQLAAGADEAVGQLRGLIRDSGSALRPVLFDLRQASRSFKDLAREVRQRPSRLLFSGAPRDRELP